MADEQTLQKVTTGCCGFVYKTNGIRWCTALFEKYEHKRLGLPDDVPIPTHVFSVIRRGDELIQAEAVFNKFRVTPLQQIYPPNELKRVIFYEPAVPFSDEEKAKFEACIMNIKATTKGYDVKGYGAQMLHILFGINLKVGKGTKFVYCNEAHEYAFNAARSGSFPHPWNDNPLELQLSPLIKKVE